MASIERSSDTGEASRCFVLGAGFSKACGLPLASELTGLLFRDAYPEGDDFPAHTRDTYLRFLRCLYPSLDFDRDWPDFEDLITLLDEWERYRRSYEGTEARSVAGTATHLKSVLLKHLGTCLCELTASASQTSKDLVADFLRKAQDTDATIVSFNWDLVLECAAKDADIDIAYGETEAPGVLLVKPHGSLNLAELDGGEYARLAATSINIRNLSVVWHNEGRLVVCADDPSDAANRILHPFAEDQKVLIEPTTRKAYLSEWIGLQWRSALHQMRSADEIVIIGYSLPDTDFRPRILFQLAGWDAQRHPRITLIDPNADRVAARYQRCVRVPIEPVESTWGEWFASQGT